MGDYFRCGPFRLQSAAFIILGAGVAVAAMATSPVSMAVAGVPLALAGLVGAARAFRSGLVVRADTVEVRNFFRTRTLKMSEISQVGFNVGGPGMWPTPFHINVGDEVIPVSGVSAYTRYINVPSESPVWLPLRGGRQLRELKQKLLETELRDRLVGMSQTHK